MVRRFDETQAAQDAAGEDVLDREIARLIPELTKGVMEALHRHLSSHDGTGDGAGAEVVHFSAVIKHRVYCLLSFPEVEDPLSPQQAELALCLRQGKGDKEIAAALKISTETVHCYLDRIYVKLKVSTRGQVAAHPALLLLEPRKASDAAATPPRPEPPAHRPATGNDGERRGTTGNDAAQPPGKRPGQPAGRARVVCDFGCYGAASPASVSAFARASSMRKRRDQSSRYSPSGSPWTARILGTSASSFDRPATSLCDTRSAADRIHT